MNTAAMPLDVYVYMAGAASTCIPAVLAIINYRRTKMTLFLQMGALLGAISIGLLIYGLTFALTRQQSVMIWFMMIADVIVYAALGAHAYLAWYILLRKYVRSPLPVTVPFVLLGLFIAGAYTFVDFTAAPGTFRIEDGFLILPNSGFTRYPEAMVMVPWVLIGLYFLRLVPKTTGKIRMGHLSYGIYYFFGGIVIIAGALIFAPLGLDAVTAVLMAAIFLAFFITNTVLRRFKK